MRLLGRATVGGIARLARCGCGSQAVRNIGRTHGAYSASRAGVFNGSLLLRTSTAHFSTAPGVESKISESEYHKLADETLDVLVTFFEDLGDELDLDGYDVSYSNGVVTLKLGEPGTYVINKQPPNLQIWLSSPVSGPKRFDFVDGDWIYKRENESLQSLLTSEVSKALNRKISVPSSH